jgi:hypothetical protein
MALVVGSGLFLLGCWPGGVTKKVEKDDVVLLEIGGEPVLTKSEFYKELAGMIGGMDPALLPKDKQERAFRDFMNFKLMVAAAKKAGLEKDAEYKKALDDQIKRLSDVLLSRMYEKQLFEDIKVSGEDVLAEYNKNKLRYVKEQGGVLVSGISFKNSGLAHSFYKEMQAKRNNKDAFDSACRQQKKGKFMEFGRIGKEDAGYNMRMQPMMPKGVRTSAINQSKLPAVNLVSEGDETWVIHISDKKNPVLFKFEEIKPQIERQLKVSKFMGERDRMLKKLEKDLKVTINEAFFKQAKPAAPVRPEAVKPKINKQGGTSA